MMAATNWNEWVGIGTLALAGATLVLATVSWLGVRAAKRSAEDTRRMATTAEQEVHALGQQIEVQRKEVEAVTAQAEASRRQVEASEAALRASVQPILVDLPQGSAEEDSADWVSYGPYANDNVSHETHANLAPWMLEIEEPQGLLQPRLYLSVPFRNAGPGIAVASEQPVLRWDDAAEGILGRLSRAVVPSGERTRARFQIPIFDDNDPNKNWRAVGALHAIRGTGGRGFGAFSVDVSYTDIGGQEQLRTRLEVAQIVEGTDSFYRVLRFHLFRDGSDTPFVSSGVSTQ